MTGRGVRSTCRWIPGCFSCQAPHILFRHHHLRFDTLRWRVDPPRAPSRCKTWEETKATSNKELRTVEAIAIGLEAIATSSQKPPANPWENARTASEVVSIEGPVRSCESNIQAMVTKSAVIGIDLGADTSFVGYVGKAGASPRFEELNSQVFSQSHSHIR